jgi:hypothetical protein
MSYVYKCQVNKHTSKKKVKTIRVVADNLVQASHMAMEKIHNSGIFMNDCIELVSIKKDFKVKNVYDMDDVFEDGDGEGEESEPIIRNPFDVSGQAPDDRIQVKHSCGEKLELVNGNWGIVKCPGCNDVIARSEISNMNGIWVYVKNQNRRM